MKKCGMSFDVGRRAFLNGAGLVTFGAAAATIVPTESKAAPEQALVAYPLLRLATLANSKSTKPSTSTYPDGDAPGVLLKLGKRVMHGVGPDGDVVAFSATCPHKGFP